MSSSFCSCVVIYLLIVCAGLQIVVLLDVQRVTTEFEVVLLSLPWVTTWVGTPLCVNKYVGIVFSDIKRQTFILLCFPVNVGTIADRYDRVSLSQSVHCSCSTLCCRSLQPAVEAMLITYHWKSLGIILQHFCHHCGDMKPWATHGQMLLRLEHVLCWILYNR